MISFWNRLKIAVITSGLISCLYTQTQAERIQEHGLTVELAGVSPTLLPELRESIRLQLSLTEDKSMSAPLADDLAFFSLLTYRRLGYPEATVDWKLEGNLAILTVEEGRQYTVGEMTFEGNTSQSQQDLESYLLRPTREKNQGLVSKSLPYVASDIQEGANLVQRFFQAQGYLDATVKEPVATTDESTFTQDIQLEIHEGKRYTFGTIEVRGDLLGQQEQIYELYRELIGSPFSEVTAENLRTQIVGLFVSKGHFKADATVQMNLNSNASAQVPVVYQVTPGPLFKVRDIQISKDLSRGATRLVDSSFSPSVGKKYEPQGLELMHRRALDSEVFNRLNVTPIPHDDQTLTLEITGEEALTRRIALYGGYETFQGPILGFEYRKVNLWNTGNAIRFKGEIAGAGWTGGVKWIDPAIFDSRYSLDAELSATNLMLFDVQQHKTALNLNLSRQWNHHISTSLFTEFSLNRVSSEVYEELYLGPESYTIAQAGFSMVFDYRDHPLIPTKGWVGSIELAGGVENESGIQFVRTEAAFAYYRPLSKKWRTSFAARTIAISGTESLNETPFSLRVFNGGSTSVRSFPEYELGLSPDSIGGTLAQTINVELSYETAPNLEIALFFDAGNLLKDESNPFAMPTDLRYAVGLGMRYKLPFGPLRIDYGYNLDRQEGEPMGALHITFGFAY